MKKYPLIGKCLAVGIILLFVGTSIIPATAQDIKKQSSTSRGNWLYVGGSGPGNYSKIQDAIDNASEGDTVFVYSGWYNESILINKSIVVSGQDRNTTFIVGGDDLYASIRIGGANVEFRRFTIQKQQGRPYYGISVGDCVNSQIEETCVRNFDIGIGIYKSDLVIVSNNIIQNCLFGITISETKNVTIKGNVIEGNEKGYGMWVGCTKNKNIIMRNTIKNNIEGVYLDRAFFTIVKENNLLQNKHQALFVDSFFSVWERNYWNRPHLLPKVILGKVFVFYWIGPWLINIDWHPAQEPYDITGMT